MKLKALLFLVLAAVLPLSAPRTAQARADVSFDYFYDALLPYGEWIEVDGYGFCWRPMDVDVDWVPYSDGYWAFTDAGWTFVGYEDFAGIVYHYGRWVNVEAGGWCWVPDYEWGPGWVSWRNSDDHIGWAPLPPRAHWQPEIGISTWVDTAYDIGPGSYNFCRARDFGAPVLRAVLINRTRNVTIIRNTVNITNITYNTYGDSPVIYNGGPNYTNVSIRSERPIPALKLVRQTHFDRADFRRGPGGFSPNARTVGNQLMVNAPIVAPPVQAAFLKEKVKRVFSADKVRDGWAGVKDAKERTELRQRFQRETKGLTPYTAPARAVAVSDLKVVPVQADPDAVPPGFTGKGPRGKGDRQPPAITGSPVAPVQPANPVADTTKPAKESGVPVDAGMVPPGATPPIDPRSAARMEREKERGKKGDAVIPPAVTGGPLNPVDQSPDGKPPRKDQGVTGNPVVTTPGPDAVIDPRAAEKNARENQRPKNSQDKPQNPVVVVPPDAPVTGNVPAEPREGRGTKPKDAVAGGFHPPVGGQQPMTGDGKPAKPADRTPGVDPGAAQAQAAADAARAAREQANIQQQKMDAEKLRGTQAEAEKARSDQERMARQRDAEAGAAAIREKQAAARGEATAQQQKIESEKLRGTQADAEKARTEQERIARQRDAEAAAAMRQKQTSEAAASSAEKEKMQAQQQQRAAQAEREKLQADQERTARQRDAASAAAAQQKQLDAQRQAEAAKQGEVKRQQMESQQQEQIAAQRRQQVEQQRATQEAAKQESAERAKAQQIEQQRAAQEAAKQQSAERARAQQIEQQRAAQDAAKQQAVEQRRQLQMEQNRAAQEAAKQQAADSNRRQQIEQQRAAQDAARQQAEGQRRALEAQRDQAARQQMEAQRGAQKQAAQAAQAAQAQAAQAQAAQAQAAQAQAAQAQAAQAQAAQAQAAQAQAQAAQAAQQQAAGAAAQPAEREKKKGKDKDR